MQTLFSYAFRPFFLLNGLFGVIGMLLWLAVLSGYGSAFSLGDPVLWHAHEMLVGFIMATIAGFMLTAGANWTGRPAVGGVALGSLVFAWLLGRIAMLFAGLIPNAAVAALDMLFPLLLLVLFGKEIVAAGNKRNYKIVGFVALLAAINVIFHLGGERLAIYLFVHAVLLLITVIAGRIIPNFTANWLRARGHATLPTNNRTLDIAATALTIAVGVFACAAPGNVTTGILAFAAALAHAARLSGWSGIATRSEPLLLALHVAYAWLPVGYLIMGCAVFGWLFAPTIALHALTMGAIGGMIMAMETRVPLGHTGRKLTAARATVVAYLLLSAAVIIRIVGPALTDEYLRTVLWSGFAWVAAFAVFLRVYWPILTRPRVDS